MNKLQHLYIKARAGLTPYDRTPQSALEKMARKCGRDEVAAIHIQLKQFRAELEMAPEWNGDEQDAIWSAIDEHRRLLLLISNTKPI